MYIYIVVAFAHSSCAVGYYVSTEIKINWKTSKTSENAIVDGLDYYMPATKL